MIAFVPSNSLSFLCLNDNWMCFQKNCLSGKRGCRHERLKETLLFKVLTIVLQILYILLYIVVTVVCFKIHEDLVHEERQVVHLTSKKNSAWLTRKASFINPWYFTIFVLRMTILRNPHMNKGLLSTNVIFSVWPKT